MNDDTGISTGVSMPDVSASNGGSYKTEWLKQKQNQLQSYTLAQLELELQKSRAAREQSDAERLEECARLLHEKNHILILVHSIIWAAQKNYNDVWIAMAKRQEEMFHHHEIGLCLWETSSRLQTQALMEDNVNDCKKAAECARALGDVELAAALDRRIEIIKSLVNDLRTLMDVEDLQMLRSTNVPAVATGEEATCDQCGLLTVQCVGTLDCAAQAQQDTVT